jgi:hypothetical protein
MMTRKRTAIALAIVGVLSVPIVARAESVADWITGYFISPEATQPQPQQAPIPLTHDAIQYGTGDGLTKQQSSLLRKGEIAFPQSYGAVIGKLGYPDGRDQVKDYYRMDDGKLVAIVYAGTKATGIEGL